MLRVDFLFAVRVSTTDLVLVILNDFFADDWRTGVVTHLYYVAIFVSNFHRCNSFARVSCRAAPR